MVENDNNNHELKRSIGLTGLVFYGVGTMIGGGIYALLGKMIGLVGVFMPISLLTAGAIALISAFSFAELSRRYPVSAGEVAYVEAAFGRRFLAQFVGLMVILTGIVSSATLCAATGGFLVDLTSMPVGGLIILTAVVLTAIAAWGVNESVAVVAVITLLEAGTLVVIIALSADRLPEALPMLAELGEARAELSLAALVSASFLAFYAFVGFEDMVNVAEEVEDVERNMPLAIFIAVAITVTLYLLIGLAAVTLEDREALAAAHTPLALMLPDTRTSAVAIGVISILAGLNGALVQMVMASRVIYGMAGKGMAPGILQRVNPVTRTPLLATLLVGLVVGSLASLFPLSGLAQASSFIILGVFALVNLSLAALRWRESELRNLSAVPWLPLVAAASCILMLLLRLLQL